MSYTAEILPSSSSRNHPSAVEFADHVEHYIHTELGYHAIAGPFQTNPLHQPLVCSPLQTVPKRGSNKRRVVMDLSYPPNSSVNSGISASSYLNEPYKLRLPGIDRYASLFFNTAAVVFSTKKICSELTGNSRSIQKITIYLAFSLMADCISILVVRSAYGLAL